MVEYSGSGESPDDPVIVGEAKDAIEGLAAERQYLQTKYANPNQGWRISGVEVIVHGDKFIDKVLVENSKGEKETVYFFIREADFQ